MTLRPAPSPLQGEGWDGGSEVETKRLYLERTTPTLTLPLQGGENFTEHYSSATRKSRSDGLLAAVMNSYWGRVK